MGELLEIWLKENHGQPMVPLTEAEVRAGEGIKDSAKEPHADRQVTVLSKESWEVAISNMSVLNGYRTRVLKAKNIRS